MTLDEKLDMSNENPMEGAESSTIVENVEPAADAVNVSESQKEEITMANNETVTEVVKPIDSIVGNEMDILSPITLERAEEEWCIDYEAGKLGEFKLNTYQTTEQGWRKRILPALGKDTPVRDVTVEMVENFLDDLSFGLTARGTKMTETAASSIYYIGRRIFQYFVDKGYAKSNVFDEVDAVHIPIVNRKEYQQKESIYLNDDQIKPFISTLLNLQPEFSAVKATLFTWLVYVLRMRPGSVLTLTWDAIEEKSGELGWFGRKLAENYRAKQQEVLSNAQISNLKGYVFVRNGAAGTEALPSDSSFASSWMKANVFRKLGLKDFRIDSLQSKKTSREGGMVPVETSADEYPILRPIYIATAFGGANGRRLSAEELKKRLEQREMLCKEYVTKQVNDNKEGE